METRFTVAEFFAGGGMARAGLGKSWRCVLANDICSAKADSYERNWGADEIVVGDVHKLGYRNSLSDCDLFWASSPCQDVSLAGRLEGLSGERSSAFWGFWKQVLEAKDRNAAPKFIVIENVRGLLSSNDGRDISTILRTISDIRYNVGVVELNSHHFVPQSRPRIFIIAARRDLDIRAYIENLSDISKLSRPLRITRDRAHLENLHWVDWKLPNCPEPRRNLESLLLPNVDVEWHTHERTQRIFELMNDKHRSKISSKAGLIGTVFMRTRVEGGVRRQRAEIRDDGLAGCLRTPGGGSSKQFLIFVSKSGKLSSRAIAPREAARLMGLDDSYILPSNTNAALHLLGDGVVVPVVTFLSENLLKPVLTANLKLEAAA